MNIILDKINKAGIKLLRPLTEEETYKTVVDEAMKLSEADYGSIFMSKGEKLERVYASSPELYQIKIRPRGFTYRAFRIRKPFIVDIKYIAKVHPKIVSIGIQSDMMIPLSYRNKSIGVVSLLSRRPKVFNEDSMEALKLFASIASLALRKVNLYAETQKALDSRDLFISMAAHELRTPLATISGYVQMLSSNKAKLSEQQARWVDELSWETFRIIQLINELLELNRIKTGKLQYVWNQWSIKEIVGRALTSFKFSHPKYKVVFKDNIVAANDIIFGDFDKLLQVMNNLLDNAAKFSPENETIELSLSLQNSHLVLQVRDHGLGIEKTDLPNIFKEFYKGSGGHKVGMGLGLFLCKNIIEQHKGFIEVQSLVGKGTLVTLKLPVAKNA